MLLLPGSGRAEPGAGEVDRKPLPANDSTEEAFAEEETPEDPSGFVDPSSDLRSVSVDDFDVPDEASFEGLWDASFDPNLAFTSPDCLLDLAGGSRTEPLGQSVYFYAVLSIPLTGCRRPGALVGQPRMVRVRGPSGLASLESSAPREERSEVEFSEARATTGSEGQVQAGSDSSPRLTPLRPGFLPEFRRRVFEARGLSRSEQRIESLIRRERSAGLLPELRLRGAHGFDQSLALASVGALPGESTTRGGSDLIMEARLTFRLQRLLVGDSEVSLERSRQALLDKAEDALEEALDQLLVFRRASALAESPERSAEQRLESSLLAEGARIRLHVMTGGWFPLEGPLPGERSGKD